MESLQNYVESNLKILLAGGRRRGIGERKRIERGRAEEREKEITKKIPEKKSQKKSKKKLG
jgi:hypothetical protein